MIANCNPVSQALLGTLFTWGVTALGSALVFIFSTGQVKAFFIAATIIDKSSWEGYVNEPHQSCISTCFC